MTLRTHCLGRQDSSVHRVRDVSLEFQPGEVSIVVGPNGSGKSSLLKLLSGELAPSRGRVSLDGIDLAHWQRTTLASRRAVLPQTVPAQLPFSVADVVALGLCPHHIAPCPTLIHQTLQNVELHNRAEENYNQLSGGQQARVHWARTLVQLHAAAGSAIYLLDEPTASLDPHWQHRCLQLLQNKAASGWTVICVLHDLNLASRYADRILLMQHGHVVLDGSSHAVIQSKQLDQVYSLEFERHHQGEQLYLHAV